MRPLKKQLYRIKLRKFGTTLMNQQQHGMISARCNKIFEQVINDSHQYNNIDRAVTNPFDEDTIDNLLYAKCWIDTAQWHMEDEIRNPGIEPVEALEGKRGRDPANQERTD